MECWQSVGHALLRLRTLSTEDAEGPAALRQALDEARAARLALASPVVNSRGRVVCAPGALACATESTSGSVLSRARPEVATMSDADRRVATWLARFGMTPADRSRVSASRSSDESPWGALFTAEAS
jgi:Phage terminase, small subunit